MEVKGDEPRGPRLEVRKRKAAEMRVKRSILEGKSYPGKQADLELIRRKHKELSAQKLREVLEPPKTSKLGVRDRWWSWSSGATAEKGGGDGR